MTLAENVAKVLLKEKAVFLRPEEPFIWASGIKSPVYCDNRLLISTIEPREYIIRSFCELIRPLGAQVVAGTATAGIPWASWIAHELKLPLVYVRSSSKDHGRQNAVEGNVKSQERCVLIEDLISTGKSSIAAAKKLQEAGAQVISVMSLFTYDFPQTAQIFDENNLSSQSLSNFEILAKVAYDNGMLNKEVLEQVLHWRKSVEFP
jgi:orotate phosphoribosyltransferase